MANGKEQMAEGGAGKHCVVRTGAYVVPLIGVPAEAGMEECDLCGELLALREVEWNGRQWLCGRCRGDGK